jgi:hypothetical protein
MAQHVLALLVDSTGFAGVQVLHSLSYQPVTLHKTGPAGLLSHAVCLSLSAQTLGNLSSSALHHSNSIELV